MEKRPALVGRLSSLFRQPRARIELTRPQPHDVLDPASPAAQPPPGEGVFVGRVFTQEEIDAANADDYVSEIIAKKESSVEPFTPRTSG